MHPPWRALVAFALAAGCGGEPAHLSLQLVLPDAPLPTDVTELRVEAAWSGGSAAAVVPFADAGSLSLVLPQAPVDVTVTGLSGGAPTWRGIARAVVASDAGVSTPLFLGQIGAFSFFRTGGAAMPPLAGSAAVPWRAGQVLISGGRGGTGALAAGEWIYDHTALAVRPWGQSRVPRAHHLAVALRGLDGQPVLFLAGGDLPDGGATDAVELDQRGSGLSLHPLGTPQRSPSAAVAPDGLELFVGCGEGGPAAADLYLPAAAQQAESDWEGALPLSSACERGQLTWIPSLGAALASGEADGSATLLSPTAGAAPDWATGVELRQGFGAVALGDAGALLQFGGEVDALPTASLAAVSPAGVADAGRLVQARADFGWLALPDGGVLVVGGRDAAGQPLDGAELLLPGGRGAVPLPPLNVPRIRPAVADISGYDAALVVSGEDADGGPAPGLEIFTYP